MSRLDVTLVLVAAMMMAHSGMSLAAEEAADEIPVAQDLAAVIALQGQPCGKVVSAVQADEDDYLATCQDGNRYRIFVNADGRVVVAKLDSASVPAGKSLGD